MNYDYEKAYSTMNDLEQTILKLNNLRAVIDSATEALETNRIRAESLNYAAYEYLELIQNELDDKFKKAWNSTVLNYRKNGILDKWQLQIQSDPISGVFYVELPQDLIDFSNLKENDKIQWQHHLTDSITITKL